ncbi:MAG: DUF1905 domain-containing protein [Chloroflexi bacterium]|nr:DUF1905 domain-containing protein [Chloroflexota bacterium]
MPPQHFQTALHSDEGSVLLLEVPANAIAALGRGKRPPVRVTLNGFPCRTTVSSYGGKYYLPVRKEIRQGRATP